MKSLHKIKTIILFYMLLFLGAILLFIWLFQIIFLNKFYELSKENELNNSMNKIREYYNNNNFDDLNFLAMDKGICIQIFKDSKNIFSETNYNKGCIPFDKNSDYRLLFRNSNKTEERFIINNTKFDNKILINAIKLEDGTYIYGSVSLKALDPAIEILKRQFIYVTLIVVLISIMIAIYLSKKISKPIEKISDGAKKIASGNYDNVIDNNVEIEELEELINTLNNTSIELEKTEKLRRELLANVSHDLKTPLTMIKAYSEMVRDITYKDKKKRNENLNVIIDETDRLNLLVNDILELSKLQANTNNLEYTVYNINKEIKNILKRYEILELTKDYTFIFNKDAEYKIKADKKRIEQVIYNLLNNAVNYSNDKKEIIINLNNYNNNYIKIEIITPDSYIDNKELELIWKKYYKVDKSHKREKVGTGLGLSIVENILKQHHVNYGVTSNKDKGTIFWFLLEKEKNEK